MLKFVFKLQFSALLIYRRPHNVHYSQRTEYKWKRSINAMNDLRLRDQCAFISISRSIITSPRESIPRRLYWKMDRKTTLLLLITSRPIKWSRVLMWKKYQQVISKQRWFALLHCTVQSVFLCVWRWFYLSHPCTGTVFIALQTHISSYGFDLFHPAVCVIFLYKEQWASALTMSSERCGNNNVRQQIFANALFRSQIEAFRVSYTLLTYSFRLICYQILQLVLCEQWMCRL